MMLIGRRLFFAGLAFTFIVAQIFSAARSIRIDETATVFRILGERAELSLGIINTSAEPIKVRVFLAMLGEDNRVPSGVRLTATLAPGLNHVVSELRPTYVPDSRYNLWNRVHYQVVLDDADANSTLASGIISVSQICPDFFDLAILKPLIAVPDSNYHVTFTAKHSVTAKPIAGVSIEASLEFEGVPPIIHRGVTDTEGHVAVDFAIPSKPGSDGEIKVIGQRNGLKRHEESDVRIDRSIRVLISTDKGIYQPGQTLHTRALVLNPSRRAVVDEELKLTVSDPDDTVLHRASLKTSRFGVASDDWTIPTNALLGDYQLKIERIEDDEEHFYAPPYTIRISRYDLPNFVVNVKPDRSFYLPGQNARLEVRAEYLFGQHVAQAKVRVVRETEREWNYREQKWDISEDEEYEGELDSSGAFTCAIDLSEQHQDLQDADYSRSKDVSYTAYVTDASTNRTEQRRFDLRVTKDPIHVYIIDEETHSRNMPFNVYISTFYADGTPASCRVAIRERTDADRESNHPGKVRALTTITTNRYGVARARGILLPKDNTSSEFRRSFADPELDLIARDRDGKFGHTSHYIWFGPADTLQVHANKALYKPREEIDVNILASGHPSSITIDVARNNRVIHRQIAALVNGRAHIRLPYSPEYNNLVAITAYGYTNRGDFITGSRMVMYPGRQELHLEAKTNQAQYRPGESASADFQITNPDGTPAEGSIGISIIDRAVEERAATDSDHRRSDLASEFYRMWGYDEQICGLSFRSMNRLDLSRPVPDDLQLVTEILLRRSGYWVDERSNSIEGVRSSFAPLLNAQLTPIKKALEARYARSRQYPTDSTSLERELTEFGIDFPAMRDPWGMAYVPTFSVVGRADVLRIISRGPDKQLGTSDDFVASEMSWPYFRLTGEAIDRAVQRYRERTDKFIRNRTELRQELLRDGINIDRIRDRWGRPYRFDFGISENFFTVESQSSGPNRRFDHRRLSRSDDVNLWTSKVDYFARTKAKIENALSEFYATTKKFPVNETELLEALRLSSADWEQLRDPWGNRYYATFKTESRYTDRAKISSFAQYPREPIRRTEVTPVTQVVSIIVVRSRGRDKTEGTHDDFDAARFARIISEQTAQDLKPEPRIISTTLSGATGAITGKVTDPNGAVISNASGTATNRSSGIIYNAVTNDEGRYIFVNLPSGFYDVTFKASGFSVTEVSEVPVTSSNITELNITLNVGAASETVNVTSDAATVQTSSTSMSAITVTRQIYSLHLNQPASTPRLREYFPETLVWQPNIETDSNGRARIDFKLADNITTWKMSVFASNENGEIGTAEKEILAFQPFFVEHDPPRVLTQGDEIALPVVLRNYLDKKQNVALRIERAPWFELLSPQEQHSEIAAGNYDRAVFRFRSIASTETGKQRVVATAAEVSDAIEKPVSVHPDGLEVTATTTRIFAAETEMKILIPENSIDRAKAELKIYPNLMSHVIDSIEGIMKRPHGCAEQTISSAYPSLLVLRYLKSKSADDSPLARRARNHLQTAYDSLINYRDEPGGFTYWGRGEADPALTAYALRFLIDARELISVEDKLIETGRDWLIKHQCNDGSWKPRYVQGSERLETATLTAFVARALAHASRNDDDLSVKGSLRRALDLIATRIDEIDEPYLIATYALGALDFGDRAGALRAAGKLRQLAHNERDSTYWKLETNTPFYAWGAAGRIEASAIAVQALAAVEDAKLDSKQSEPAQRTLRELIERGLLFLLNQKDCYGVWYTTQATVNVLDALTAVLGQSEPSRFGDSSKLDVIVNDSFATSVSIPREQQLSEPIVADLSKYFAKGLNSLQIRRGPGSPQASAQIIESHYEPWTSNKSEGIAGALRLNVSFDKHDAAINENITCDVTIERVGFRGCGMLLAEIGLPPGANVDRASVDRAIKESDCGVDEYDLLPDRIIFYVWPRAGGTRFQFKFKPRFGLLAKSAPSLVYDYYNPEARAIVTPTIFNVR